METGNSIRRVGGFRGFQVDFSKVNLGLTSDNIWSGNMCRHGFKLDTIDYKLN